MSLISEYSASHRDDARTCSRNVYDEAHMASVWGRLFDLSNSCSCENIILFCREGLVKHNPNTIRKVVVPFILTFKNGISDVKDKLKNMVRITGKLDDMPVYKDSLQIAGKLK